jgi:carboxylesterase
MTHHSQQIDSIYKSGKIDAAVLLIHGFTGTPDCMRGLANHLNKSGFTVHAPLLPGHGTTREDLEKTGWNEWYACCQESFFKLRETHKEVFVAGISLGGLLTLKLAEDHSQAVAALTSLAAPAFLQNWVHVALPIIAKTPLNLLYRYQKKLEPDIKDPVAKQNYWSIQDMPIKCIHSLTKLQAKVRTGLPKIVSPILLMHSRYDSTAPYESMNYIARRVSSKITETITLENSYHLLTVDYEKDLVNAKTSEFFLRCLGK